MWNMVAKLLKEGFLFHDTYIISEYQTQWNNYNLFHKLENNKDLPQSSKDYLINIAVNNSLQLYKYRFTEDYSEDYYFERVWKGSKDLTFIESFAKGKYTTDSSRANLAYQLLNHIVTRKDSSSFYVNAIKILVDNGINYSELFKVYETKYRSNDVMGSYVYRYTYPFREKITWNLFSTEIQANSIREIFYTW